MRMEELSAQQQARIRKLNAGDAAVYEMAKAVFDHRLRQYGIRDDPRCAAQFSRTRCRRGFRMQQYETGHLVQQWDDFIRAECDRPCYSDSIFR
eukprot:6185784-Pleurochrysis_carterae.AAC.1